MIHFKNNNKKHITIRDIRIGSIISIHLSNEARGDIGTVNCEICGIWNDLGGKYFKNDGMGALIYYKGEPWIIYMHQIKQIIKY